MFFFFFFPCFSFLSCIYVGCSASILLGNSRVPRAVRAENQSHFRAPALRPRLYWLSSLPQCSPEWLRALRSIFAAPSPKAVSLEGGVRPGRLGCCRLGRGVCVSAPHGEVPHGPAGPALPLAVAETLSLPRLRTRT